MHMFSILLRSVAVGIMLWGFSQLDTIMATAWIVLETGGHWQFLTIQGLAATCLTLIAGLLTDFVPSIQVFHKIHRGLQMIALPISVVVSSIYWSLLWFFPSLILRGVPPAPGPPSSSPTAPPLARIPLTLDLALHASPIIALIIDFLVIQVPYSSFDINFSAPVLIAVAALWYATFVEYCASHNKTFPYPFLADSDFKGRVYIYAGASLIALLIFRGLNRIHPRKMTGTSIHL